MDSLGTLLLFAVWLFIGVGFGTYYLGMFQ